MQKKTLLSIGIILLFILSMNQTDGLMEPTQSDEEFSVSTSNQQIMTDTVSIESISNVESLGNKFVEPSTTSSVSIDTAGGSFPDVYVYPYYYSVSASVGEETWNQIYIENYRNTSMLLDIDVILYDSDTGDEFFIDSFFDVFVEVGSSTFIDYYETFNYTGYFYVYFYVYDTADPTWETYTYIETYYDIHDYLSIWVNQDYSVLINEYAYSSLQIYSYLAYPINVEIYTYIEDNWENDYYQVDYRYVAVYPGNNEYNFTFTFTHEGDYYIDWEVFDPDTGAWFFTDCYWWAQLHLDTWVEQDYENIVGYPADSYLNIHNYYQYIIYVEIYVTIYDHWNGTSYELYDQYRYEPIYPGDNMINYTFFFDHEGDYDINWDIYDTSTGMWFYESCYWTVFDGIYHYVDQDYYVAIGNTAYSYLYLENMWGYAFDIGIRLWVHELDTGAYYELMDQYIVVTLDISQPLYIEYALIFNYMQEYDLEWEIFMIYGDHYWYDYCWWEVHDYLKVWTDQSYQGQIGEWLITDLYFENYYDWGYWVYVEFWVYSNYDGYWVEWTDYYTEFYVYPGTNYLTYNYTFWNEGYYDVEWIIVEMGSGPTPGAERDVWCYWTIYDELFYEVYQDYYVYIYEEAYSQVYLESMVDYTKYYAISLFVYDEWNDYWFELPEYYQEITLSPNAYLYLDYYLNFTAYGSYTVQWRIYDLQYYDYLYLECWWYVESRLDIWVEQDYYGYMDDSQWADLYFYNDFNFGIYVDVEIWVEDPNGNYYELYDYFVSYMWIGQGNYYGDFWINYNFYFNIPGNWEIWYNVYVYELNEWFSVYCWWDIEGNGSGYDLWVNQAYDGKVYEWVYSELKVENLDDFGRDIGIEVWVENEDGDYWELTNLYTEYYLRAFEQVGFTFQFNFGEAGTYWIEWYVFDRYGDYGQWTDCYWIISDEPDYGSIWDLKLVASTYEARVYEEIQVTLSAYSNYTYSPEFNISIYAEYNHQHMWVFGGIYWLPVFDYWQETVYITFPYAGHYDVRLEAMDLQNGQIWFYDASFDIYEDTTTTDPTHNDTTTDDHNTSDNPDETTDDTNTTGPPAPQLPLPFDWVVPTMVIFGIPVIQRRLRK
ncbi:MAG: hypothetical protein INQ03_25405 [Candidatus Heimdallarchaeota archaeon]|nr:hypothetical protein [Candidatus Heimdallarchaeota archaeon]